jgi:CubicO group peptidase (beta-lactamase class C family)
MSSRARLQHLQQHFIAAADNDIKPQLKVPRPSEVMAYEVGGSCASTFESVESAFRHNFELGVELGSQLCIYYKNECVVDLWGKTVDAPCSDAIVNEVGRGYMDTLDTYSIKSVQQVMSSTKNVTAICIGMCVDRGLLDYNEKVATYWPEFAQNGKGDVKVADVLRHDAGLVRFAKLARDKHITDQAEMAKLIESSPQRWFVSSVTPVPEKWKDQATGRRGYHAVTRGHILSCLLQRVDPLGRTVGQFVSDEIQPQLGIGLYIGVSPERQHDGSIDIADSTHYMHPWGWRNDPDMRKYTAGREGASDASPHLFLTSSSPLSTQSHCTGGAMQKFAKESSTKGGAILHMMAADQGTFNSEYSRQVEVPSGNGLTNARALAKLGRCN